jgi:hypothetical protein
MADVGLLRRPYLCVAWGIVISVDGFERTAGMTGPWGECAQVSGKVVSCCFESSRAQKQNTTRVERNGVVLVRHRERKHR